MKTSNKISLSESYTFLRARKKIDNRTVLAAMTNKQSYDNGVISNNEIDWLFERAKGGFSIITTAATNVSKEAKAWDGEFGVYDDIHIPGLRKLTSSIHSTNSIVFAQLFHGGLKSPQSITGKIPISASEIECDGSKTGKSREATTEDIDKIINDFTESAIRCLESGFDGIELHGAHGYLLSQFLGTTTNLRDDEWGGDLEGRSKLIIEIYKSIKNNVPESFIVGIRISPEIESIGINLKDTIDLIAILKNLGFDFIHISCWDAFVPPVTYLNTKKTLTEIITESYSDLPTIISTGGVWSGLDAQKLLNQGADLVGVARVGIGHPYWAKMAYDINYNPKKPPYTREYLKKMKLSNSFIDYMSHWKNFVIKN